MGLPLKSIKYFEEIVSVLGYRSFRNLEMCQLGDAYIRQNARRYLFNEMVLRGKNPRRYFRADEYFEDKGFNVTTIDLGIGPESISDRVFRFDLSKPLPDNFNNFDFVVDFGTGEHIANQFEFFRNIDQLCKINGVVIRINPSSNHGGPHGLGGYTFEFYAKLAAVCKYDVIDVRETFPQYKIRQFPSRPGRYMYAAFLKTEDSDFTEEEFDVVKSEFKLRGS